MERSAPSNNSQPLSLLQIPLERLAPSASNPRMVLDKDAFKELKASIMNNGLLQPIAVRVAGDNYEILGGHRRYLAVHELAREHPGDDRFVAIPALVVDVEDNRVAAARLAENINRADLNPLEIAEGIADAIENGMTEDELAESLGWKTRNVYRYRQFHKAPGWLKNFAIAVPLASKKLDEHGAPVVDGVTDAPVHNIEKLPGLAFTHLFQLLTFYNQLHEADEAALHEHGGENFRPQAERIVKKLAREAAKEDWTITKLRNEIKRATAPAPEATEATAAPVPTQTKPPFSITAERATIDLSRKLARAERQALAEKLVPALAALGFKHVAIGDAAPQ